MLSVTEIIHIYIVIKYFCKNYNIDLFFMIILKMEINNNFNILKYIFFEYETTRFVLKFLILYTRNLFSLILIYMYIFLDNKKNIFIKINLHHDLKYE